MTRLPFQPDLAGWLQRQGRRERQAIRLEDALLADRYAAYFGFRLRFFGVRTVFVAILHAIKILLVAEAFAQRDLLIILAVGAAAAIANDFWWGALERMRQTIRTLRRNAAIHRVPAEIGRWLRLTAVLSVVGTAAAVTWIGVLLTSGRAVQPVEAYAAILLGGAALRLTARAYHSGAYALRRVYRPMGSLLVADAVGVIVLLGVLPLCGLWAFSVAEAAGLAGALSITMLYTGRTYRVLGLPPLRMLFRAGRGVPSPAMLRSALSPGLAYALVGAESLILLVVLAVPEAAGKSSLLVLLAALGPLVRAGFDWAQLLYFDLVRLGVPLLRGLRRRFDVSVLILAVVVGVATALAAMGVGAGLLGIRDPVLLLMLLPLFSSRSLLAAAQIRAFTGGAYLRLAVVGALGSLGSLAALSVTTSGVDRLAALSLMLAASFAALLISWRAGADDENPVLALPEWLARLRRTDRGVMITRVRFDARCAARGVTTEDRQTEAWRRRQVAARIAARVGNGGGAAAWIAPYELACFGPAIDTPWLVRLGGGLILDTPLTSRFPAGEDAAAAMCETLGLTAARTGAGLDALVAEFGRLFPAGVVYRAGRPAPHEVTAIGSRARSELFRAALSYAEDLSAVRRGRWEVSALVEDGALEAIFLIDHRSRGAARRRWARLIWAQNLLLAAAGPQPQGTQATG